MFLNSMGAATLAALAALPVSAQLADTNSPSEGTSSPDRLLADWRAEHGSSWQMHVNSRTGTLEMLYGGNAPSPFKPNTNEAAEWYQIARFWIAETYAMHGVEGDQLVESQFLYMPLGQVNTTDKITVRFEQFGGEVPVENGSINVLFDTSGRLLSIHTTAAPDLELSSNVPSTGAGFASLVAARAFQDELGVAPTSSGSERLVHAWVDDGETRRWTLAWEVEALHEFLDGTQPLGRRYMVDANGRAVLKVEDTVHNFDVFGTIRANATPGLTADRTANPPVPAPMPRVQITSSAGTVETDRNGDFTITGVNTPLDLTVRYFGQFTDVNNDGGANYTVTFPGVQPNQQNDLLMNPAPNERLTSQPNAQLHINVLRDFIRDRFPTDPTADFRARANVNQNNSCNAFFVNSSVNFFTSGGGCNNTAFSTVVAHEMGHWLNVRYGTGNGSDGMGEGNADVFAMYTYDDPIIARFFFTNGGSIRTGTNTRQFCGDNNPGCWGGNHDNGEVWMGAAWKIRENLNASLGNAAGDLTADLLFLGWLNAYDQTEIRSIIETQWLTLDDDDGDINNGSPNYPAIDAGFRAQGFPGHTLQLVSLTDVTVLPDTVDEVGPYVIDAHAVTTPSSTLTGVDIFFRDGPGPFVSVSMSSMNGVDFSGSIPGHPSPASVEYYVRAIDDLFNEDFFPEGGAGDPIRFRIGDVTPIYMSNFDINDAGFIGGAPGDNASTGIWERGDPRGTAAQPEDDHTPTGTGCWFTGQGPPGGGVGQNDVDGGRTTLLSPIFNAADFGAVELTYWRWYSNTQGNNPNTDIFEVDISADGGASWINVETVGPNGSGTDGGWVQASFDLATIVTPTSTMLLRFVASDFLTDAVVEAAIDDIEIVGIEMHIPPPVRYCTVNANSTGQSAQMDTFGSSRVGRNDLLLLTWSVPRSTFGFYFFGDSQTQIPLNGSMGVLCVNGTNLFRLPPVQSDPFFESAFYQLDFTDPGTNAINITSGSTWNFQMWFRDSVGGQATSNTTDALQITFGD